LRGALSDTTDGNFAIALQPAGVIAPAIGALDAVVDGKADCAQTVLSYSWTSERPTFSLPIGSNQTFEFRCRDKIGF
jgi:TRAP-type mannitol/chloroaromatic compound transport system substrate-binding protein